MIGGIISEANSRPFQVALLLRVGVNGEQGFCGGALVHAEWVLTAAHCCFHNDQQVDNVQAVLGAHSLYDRYENGRRIVNVAEVIPHPDFVPDTFANDIALLKLANTIQLTGVTFVSPTLREKLMTVMTDPLCNTSYFGQLPANTVCGYSGLAGTCKGDNGGPLTIVYNATEETILIGVASFVGAGGCSDDVPSVFTRVQRYLTWISDVTGIVID
ncbi:Trypsin [Papilio machaon]|uniref:Trypsin n=1 Tax=Papilio machaon TaxID=76193 RepID=A0A0N0PC19_PAPMA|nr:Trypsin [Papilio machaon]